VFHLHDAEQIAKGLVRVGNKREGQRLLFNEVAVGFERIARNTNNLCSCLLEFFMQIAKSLRLGSAARRVIFGIKVQDSPLTDQRGLGDVAGSAGGGKVGNFLSDGDLTHCAGSNGNKAATTRRPSDIKML